MHKVLDIPIQKLFLITIILKLISSGLGWYFGRPWELGFFVPLALMLAYISLGLKRRDSTVTDEKFADSCYYLGFIFTISSIIFSLFDLPNIGTKIQEIAVRFGAAMVSTVLGLGVRVYLVSFKQDVAEALVAAEDAALEATRRLAEQMVMALESLKDFEYQVHAATKLSVERVNMEVEHLSKTHAGKLAEFFVELSDRNQAAFTLALAEMRNVSRKLSESVDDYAGGMQKNLASIESRVGAFADAVTSRLEKTTFPDDYFARHLEGPMGQLKESAHALAGGVKSTSDEVHESTVVLSKALNKLRLKAVTAEASLESISKLTDQQQAVLDSASSHIETLGGLSDVLTKVEIALSGTAEIIRENSLAASHLALGVTGVIAEGSASRKDLDAALGHVIAKLDAQANAGREVAKAMGSSAAASIDATSAFSATVREGANTTRTAATAVATQLVHSIEASQNAIEKLNAAMNASSSIADKLGAISELESRANDSLNCLTKQAEQATHNTKSAVAHLQNVSNQLGAIETALHAQGADLKLLSNSLAKVELKVNELELAPLNESSVSVNAEPEVAEPLPTLAAEEAPSTKHAALDTSVV